MVHRTVHPDTPCKKDSYSLGICRRLVQGTANSTELDQLLFKCISNTKYKLLFKIVFQILFSITFAAGIKIQNTKYIFVRYLKYKILFKVTAVEDRPTYFIAL